MQSVFLYIILYMDIETKNTPIIPAPRTFKRFLFVLLGAVVFSLNMNSFVAEASLIPGGFAGISLLIQRTVEKFTKIHIPYTALYWTLNALPVYISFRYIGKKFTVFSLIMIITSSLLTDFIPAIKITDEPLLCAVF